MASDSAGDLDAVRDYWTDIEDHTATGLAPHEKEVFPVVADRAVDAETILEIGTARGRWLDALRAAGIDAEMYGLDITEAVVEADCRGLKADIRALPLRSNIFDLTFSIGVIEHFPNSGGAVDEHARVTRPGGWVFLITPHLGPITVKRYITFWLRDEYRQGTFEQIRGRNLTRRTLRTYFEAAGLVDIETGCYGDVWLPAIGQYRPVQSVVRTIAGNILGDFVYAVGRVPTV